MPTMPTKLVTVLMLVMMLVMILVLKVKLSDITDDQFKYKLISKTK